MSEWNWKELGDVALWCFAVVGVLHVFDFFVR